jgi:hypothetical protein
MGVDVENGEVGMGISTSLNRTNAHAVFATQYHRHFAV